MSAPQKMSVFSKLFVSFRSHTVALEPYDNGACVIIGQILWWLTTKSYSGEFICFWNAILFSWRKNIILS